LFAEAAITNEGSESVFIPLIPFHSHAVVVGTVAVPYDSFEPLQR
jgi:hypothetical protein